MGGGSSNKPIVFVFGAKKGDADGRKKNLSAINTQVAYRAHERRREKKSKQRAQAREEGKADQPPPSIPSTSTSIKLEDNVNFNQFVPNQIHPQSRLPNFDQNHVASHNVAFPGTYFQSTEARPSLTLDSKHLKRSLSQRRNSDTSSALSSEHDAVWSNSPSSARQSTPGTDMDGSSPLALVQLNGYFDKALDPFFRLPTAASDREKWLVHFYFREMGHYGFGTHSNALFCPDRDWVSTYVSSKSLCFQWILIHAEEHLGRIGVLPDQTLTVERKAKAYGALNSLLRGRAVNRDEGISSIMYAAILDTQQTNMHLMALDRLINDTGGLDAFLDGPLGIAHPEHIATCYAFGQCPITSLRTLEETKTRFLGLLRELHDAARIEQEEKRRLRNRRPWDALSRQIVDGNGVLVPSNHDEHFRYYIKAQQDCFTSDCLGQLLNSTLNLQTDYSSQARHMAAMVQILLILKEFEPNYLARAMFLKRLKHVAEMSTARDPQTGHPRLSHAGLLLMNSFVRQEVQTYFDRSKALAKGIAISKMIIDCLKIFPLLKQSTRALLVSWLRDWLCYNDQFEDAGFTDMGDEDLTAISVEITRTWTANTVKSS